ncbi:hypothetical protein Tco_0058454 [Tanacetum coccineum]
MKKLIGYILRKMNEKKDDADDDKSIDLEMTDDEETDDEVLQGKEQVNDNEDEEMTNVEVEESGNGDEEDTFAAKSDAKKTEEAKYDSKKVELHSTSSNLSINSLLDIKIQSEVPHIQSPSVLKVPVFVIFEPSVLTPVQETPLATPVTTLPPPSLRVAKLEKDVSKLKKIDHSAKALTTLNSNTLESSKIQTSTINLKQESKKSASEILKIKKEQAEKHKMPKYTIKSTDKAALKEFDQKSALCQIMHENKSFNRNPANHRLYHALMEALIEDENAMDKGVADTGKKTKRRRTKESESSKKQFTTKETPKGKAPSKGSKIGKSASVKELVEEPITEVVMNDTGEDVVLDDDQPQDTSKPKTAKTPNPEWFKQPPRPLTLDSEWNKCQVDLVNLNNLGSTKWSLLQRIL